MSTAVSAPSRSTLAVLVVGLAAGFLSGVFGVGGGILIVPGLVIVAKMDQRLAHGTSLAAVLPIAGASVITYGLHDNIDWPVAFFLAVGAVLGALLGTRLLHVLPHRTLAILFAVVLIVSAIRLFIPMDADGRADLSAWMCIALLLVGLAAGVLAGLLGVGGGIILVPAMIVLLGIPPVIAKGTSLAVIIPTAVMGTWRNRRRGNADMSAAAVLGGAGILTAFFGAWVADRMNDALSNALFAVLLSAVAIRLLRDAARDRP
jgi:uncharacterized protein